MGFLKLLANSRSWLFNYWRGSQLYCFFAPLFGHYQTAILPDSLAISGRDAAFHRVFMWNGLLDIWLFKRGTWSASGSSQCPVFSLWAVFVFPGHCFYGIAV